VVRGVDKPQRRFLTSRRGREVVGVEMVLLDALASGGLLASFFDSRKVFLDGSPMRRSTSVATASSEVLGRFLASAVWFGR
jgi:hypothetical protein